MAGKGTGEQSLARRLYRRLEEDWLLIADRNFYNWADWCTAADTGAALLWRVKADLTLPVLELLPDGSYPSVLVNPKISGKARQAAHRGRPRRGGPGRRTRPATCRVIEYEVPDRDGDGKGEVIALITTITEITAAAAAAARGGLPPALGARDRERPAQDATCAAPGGCCGPRARTWSARRSTATCSPTTPSVALICRAATEADIDPDRVKFKRTVRIIRRRAADPAAFPP